MKNIFRVFVLVLCAGLFSGCTLAGAAVGAGATVGVAAAQEGGLKGAYNDTKIRAEINRLWFERDVDMFRKVDMTVNQGRVLLTGVVQNPEHRVEAVRLAWQPKGVGQVINEIRVAESPGVTGFAKDTWITTRLRTTITFDKDIQSINYSIDTVAGVVYLMGVAQNRLELNRVLETARTIPGVKQVVSYVKFAGEDLRTGATSGSSAAYDSGGGAVQHAPPTDLSYDSYESGNSGQSHDSYNSYDSGSGGESAAVKPVQTETLLDSSGGGWQDR